MNFRKISNQYKGRIVCRWVAMIQWFIYFHHLILIYSMMLEWNFNVNSFVSFSIIGMYYIGSFNGGGMGYVVVDYGIKCWNWRNKMKK